MVNVRNKQYQKLNNILGTWYYRKRPSFRIVSHFYNAVIEMSGILKATLSDNGM